MLKKWRGEKEKKEKSEMGWDFAGFDNVTQCDGRIFGGEENESVTGRL